VRELQGINYCELMDVFNEAEKVIDRKELCVERMLHHLGNVIGEVNQKLGK
jgi:hypothetical protein